MGPVTLLSRDSDCESAEPILFSPSQGPVEINQTYVNICKPLRIVARRRYPPRHRICLA
jgi:hypothetical protein